MAKVLSIEQKPAPAHGARETTRGRRRRNLGSPRVGPTAGSAAPPASRWPLRARQRGSPARVRTCLGDEAADAAAHLRNGVRACGASATAARRLGGATARAGHATACGRHATWRGAAGALPRHARKRRRRRPWRRRDAGFYPFAAPVRRRCACRRHANAALRGPARAAGGCVPTAHARARRSRLAARAARRALRPRRATRCAAAPPAGCMRCVRACALQRLRARAELPPRCRAVMQAAAASPLTIS